jgi:regulator of cell morphogenesis and NO signaling
VTSLPEALSEHKSLVGLVQRLQEEHQRWRTSAFPKIDQRFHLLERLPEGARPAWLEPLRRVFLRLWDELEGHLRREENVLFPAIVQAERGLAGSPGPLPSFGSMRHPVAMMESEHAGIERLLEQMGEIAGGYWLPQDANVNLRALLQELRTLEAAVREHTALENEILFPRAVKLQGS